MMFIPGGVHTEVTFLGTDAVVPGGGGDTASFVINKRFMVDTGWYGAIKMRQYDIEPLLLDTLILTHCHHDHYIGLPHLLFELAMRSAERPNRPPLRIIGPADDMPRVVGLSREFLQIDRFPAAWHEPELVPLRPGEGYENDDFALATCSSVHPVPGLCYRFTDKLTGLSVAFTGDTSYDPAIPALARGVDLLIHEASYGPNPGPPGDKWGHSGAPDAARVAHEAAVKRLALVHSTEHRRAASVDAAKTIFPNSFWPEDGETVAVG